MISKAEHYDTRKLNGYIDQILANVDLRLFFNYYYFKSAVIIDVWAHYPVQHIVL